MSRKFPSSVAARRPEGVEKGEFRVSSRSPRLPRSWPLSPSRFESGSRKASSRGPSSAVACESQRPMLSGSFARTRHPRDRPALGLPFSSPTVEKNP